MIGIIEQAIIDRIQFASDAGTLGYKLKKSCNMGWRQFGRFAKTN